MNSSPKTLSPGAYWYLVPGKDPVICEKREGESFVGPLAVPVAAGLN